MCECHDDEEDHDRWFAEEAAYWERYFGLLGKTSAERRRILDQWRLFVFNDRALREELGPAEPES